MNRFIFTMRWVRPKKYKSSVISKLAKRCVECAVMCDPVGVNPNGGEYRQWNWYCQHCLPEYRGLEMI